MTCMLEDKRELELIKALTWWNNLETEERNKIVKRLFKRRQRKNVQRRN